MVDFDPSAPYSPVENNAFDPNADYSPVKVEPEKPTTLTQRVEDVGISGARGFLSGVQTIVDAFGAESKASKAIQSVDTQLAEYLSAGANKDAKRQQEIMDEAKGKGYLANFEAGLRAISVAPAKTLVNAFGQAVPFVLGSIGAALAGPEAAGGIGLLSAGEAALAGTGVELGLGAATGLGATKEKIYSDVKQSLMEAKVPEDVAEKTAQDAQAYGGKNLDQIIAGGIVGAGMMAAGPAGMLAKRISAKVLGDVATKTAAEEGAGVLARTAEGGAKGAATTSAQAAQTQIAGNVARQREGEDVPTMEGVAEAAVPAAITGGLLGGVTEGVLGKGKKPPVEEDLGADLRAKDEQLRQALETLQKSKEPEKIFNIAEQYRDKLPAFGEVLDDPDMSRDEKLTKILELTKQIDLKPGTIFNPLLLAAPEIKKSENIRQVYNNALDIADKSGTSLADLKVDQGPEGYRIVSSDGQVMSDPMPNGTDQEALMVLEGLKRTHDMRQMKQYKEASAEYKEQYDNEMVTALLRASDEVQQPMRPVTMAQIEELDPNLAEKIRESRRDDPTVESKAEIEAPVSFEELNKRGASRIEQIELARDQKPYTGNTGEILPETIQNILGPRPSEPKKAASTPEQLSAMSFSQKIEASKAKAEEGAKEENKPAASAYPSNDEVMQARSHIENRINELTAAGGKQSENIATGLRKAVDNIAESYNVEQGPPKPNQFTPNQLVHAFNMAEISARLLGKTTSDPHVLEFVNKIVFGDEGADLTNLGTRTFPTNERLQGLIQLSLDPKYLENLSNTTAAHEAFHVLQDLYASFDKQGSTIINNAFKGAKSFDDIDSNLLRKLKQMKDPDTGMSVYDTLVDHVPQEYIDSFSQGVRERELQAYVFGYLDNAVTRGNQNLGGIGAAYVRFLNYLRDFKERVGNYFRGLGYQNVEDVLRGTIAGERQKGLGVEGQLVKRAIPGEESEQSTVRMRAGQENLKKYGIAPGETKVKTRRLAEALEARQRAKYGTIERNDYSNAARDKIAKWMVDEVKFAHDQQGGGVDAGVGWYSEKYQRALDHFSEIFPELKTDKNKRDIFTAAVALSSDGQKVFNNFTLAAKAYEEYRRTGKFPEEFKSGGRSIVSMETNLKILNDLIAGKGEAETVKYLMQEHTVSELAKLAREDGIKFSTSYKADTKLPMAALLFGPKLGAFYANLMGSHGYLTMDRWWSRTFNRYRGQLVSRITGMADNPYNSKNEPIGLARFKVMLAEHDRRNSPWTTMSDREAIARLQDFRDSYEAKGYKNGTDIERAANTLYKDAFENTEDTPFNASDRAFMISSANRAKAMLERQGIHLSLADIQAVLWYYEKRLYGELGARQTADVSYEDAAKRVVNDNRGKSERWATHDAPEPTVVGPNGSLIEVRNEETPAAEVKTSPEKPTGEVEFSRAAAQTGENVEEFKKWWKKSKVVDEEGQPQRYYHGTDKAFKKFSKPFSAAITINGEKQKGPFFFTPKPTFAEGFGNEKTFRMIPVFLSVQHPFDFENPVHIKQLKSDLEFQRDINKEFNVSEKYKMGYKPEVILRLLEEGFWKAIEVPFVQRAIRRNGFDGFHLIEGGIKNLAVYDPKQIKSVFNDFKRGTAKSEEFSRARAEIAKTGQQQEVEQFSEKYFKGFGAIKEFFDPMSRVTNVPALMQLRNLRNGVETMSHEVGERLSKALGKATPADSKAVYEYMTDRNKNAATIKNAEVKAAAIETRNRIAEQGQELVKAGLLPEASFEKYVDQYLPRLYLYNELTNRNLKTPMGGPSKMEYLMKRDENLTKQERDILGEIRDPAYLTYVALTRPARDLAFINYLNNLAATSFKKGEAPWVAANSLVEWRGSKMSPYSLKNMAQELRDHIAPEAGLRDKVQAATMVKESYRMDQIANEAIDSFREGQIDLTNYKQMPNDRRYGPLTKAWVQRGIYDDLVGTYIPVSKENRPFLERIFGDEHSTINKIGAQWKLFKTTLNIPTQATNVISNVFALHTFGGVPLQQIPGYIIKSLEQMKNNSGNWQDAKRYGISGGTMASAELGRALDRLKQFNRANSSATTPFSAFTMARVLYGELTGKAGDLYQKSEVIFKFAKFLHEREADIAKGEKDQATKNMNISKAVDAANDTLFDYSLVNRNIRYLRNTPLGLPFVTYYYKAFPMFIKTAVEHPLRFAPYVALAYALPAGTMAALNLSQDELDAMRKSLPEYIRNNGSLHFLPYRDKEGNIAYADTGGFFPWSSFTDPLMALYRSGGDIKEFGKGVGRLITPSGPMVAAISAMSTGADPMTGKPIMDPRDTPTNQAIDMFNYIANQAIPPMLNVDFRNPNQGGGALTKIYNSMFEEGTGKQRKGTPTPDMFESMTSLFGLRMMPLKADMQRALNAQYMQNEINRIKSFQTIVARDQSMNQDQRIAKVKELNDYMVSKSQDLRQYVQDTQAASGAAARLRKTQ